MNYSNWQLVHDIARFVRPYKKRFWLGTFCNVSSEVAWLFPPWAIAEITNFAADYETGQSWAYFWRLIILFVVVILYRFPTRELSKVLHYRVAEQVDIDSRLYASRHLLALDLHWHQVENSGNKVQKMNKAGQSFNRLIRLYNSVFIPAAVTLCGTVLIMFSVDWVFNVVLIIFCFTYFHLSYRLTKKAGKQAYQVNKHWEEFQGRQFETVHNILTVKTLGLYTSLLQILKKLSHRLIQSAIIRIRLFRTRAVILNIYRNIARMGILIYAVVQVLSGHLELGSIALFYMYFSRMEMAARDLSDIAHEFYISKVAIFRNKEMLDVTPAIEVAGSELFSSDWQSIDFHNVNFSYGAQEVLKGFTMRVKRGEKVGIVGLSGAGKSTLFKLLLKLYDDYEGEIRFDEKKLKDIKRSSYVKHFSAVLQETEVFNFSLKDNVILGQEYDEKRFEHALEIAHVKDFLPKLSEGVDTLIGEKGVKLSGGEKQRLGIARAVYKNPEILYFDEATSHLDAESEEKIQEGLHKFFEEVTAIVIAHRLSTLKDMDRIVVMEGGQVVEEGRFEELIERGGQFANLWEKQKIS